MQHFKDGIRKRHPGMSKYWPVTVRNNETLEDVVTKMAKDNLHRVFVVDGEGKPVDVISQVLPTHTQLNCCCLGSSSTILLILLGMRAYHLPFPRICLNGFCNG